MDWTNLTTNEFFKLVAIGAAAVLGLGLLRRLLRLTARVIAFGCLMVIVLVGVLALLWMAS